MRWGQGVGAGDGVLVGVWTSGSADGAEASLAELTGLAKTASAPVYDGVTKRRQQPDPATCIESGEAEELREIVDVLLLRPEVEIEGEVLSAEHTEQGTC
jgi:50S ribosomal subunit-associated GTPase HflX